MVTPAGLKAWARRVRAEARGGNRNGLLGWCRKALSAYTWCRTNKGPQNDWLYKIKKTDTESCKRGSKTMTGTHVVEECPELDEWRPRKAVWKEWREALGGRAVSKKEAEEEGDLLGAFFYRVYEFLFSFSNPPPIVHRPCLPARYTIKFVPATNSVISPVITASTNSVISPVIISSAASPVIVASTDYSVVSSVNFVPAAAVPSSPSSTDHSVVSSVNFVPAAAISSSSSSSSTCIVPTH